MEPIDVKSKIYDFDVPSNDYHVKLKDGDHLRI